MKLIWIIKMGIGGFRVLYQKLFKPWGKWLGGTLAIDLSYEYGLWKAKLATLGTTSSHIEGMPIYISKMHSMFIWLYNVNIIHYVFVKLSNIAFFFKVPLYLVTIIVLLIAIIVIVVFFKWLFRVLFANKPIIDIKEPTKFMQTLLVERNMKIKLKESDEIMKLQKEIKDYQTKLKNLASINKNLKEGLVPAKSVVVKVTKAKVVKPSAQAAKAVEKTSPQKK